MASGRELECGLHSPRDKPPVMGKLNESWISGVAHTSKTLISFDDAADNGKMVEKRSYLHYWDQCTAKTRLPQHSYCAQSLRSSALMERTPTELLLSCYQEQKRTAYPMRQGYSPEGELGATAAKELAPLETCAGQYDGQERNTSKTSAKSLEAEPVRTLDIPGGD